jgi:aspartate/methionine/tyrosine aminotransferase
MAAFADLAAANGALLVSDEVYRTFDYEGRSASALAEDSPNVLVRAAVSKSMAITGFRVGHAVFPAAGEAFGRAREESLRFSLCTPRVAAAADRLRAHLS